MVAWSGAAIAAGWQQVQVVERNRDSGLLGRTRTGAMIQKEGIKGRIAARDLLTAALLARLQVGTIAEPVAEVTQATAQDMLFAAVILHRFRRVSEHRGRRHGNACRRSRPWHADGLVPVCSSSPARGPHAQTEHQNQCHPVHARPTSCCQRTSEREPRLPPLADYWIVLRQKLSGRRSAHVRAETDLTKKPIARGPQDRQGPVSLVHLAQL
jgi:hypothetical protein